VRPQESRLFLPLGAGRVVRQGAVALRGWCGTHGSGICGAHGLSGGMGVRCGCGTHARRFGRSPSIQRESLLRIEKWEVVKMLRVL